MFLIFAGTLSVGNDLLPGVEDSFGSPVTFSAESVVEGVQ